MGGSQRLGKGGGCLHCNFSSTKLDSACQGLVFSQQSAMVLLLSIFLRLFLFICFINSVCVAEDNILQRRLKMEMIARLPVLLQTKGMKPSPRKRFLGLEIPDYV